MPLLQRQLSFEAACASSILAKELEFVVKPSGMEGFQFPHQKRTTVIGRVAVVAGPLAFMSHFTFASNIFSLVLLGFYLCFSGVLLGFYLVLIGF